MEAAKRRSQRDYTMTFKLSVVVVVNPSRTVD
jgi:hypothetical protein